VTQKTTEKKKKGRVSAITNEPHAPGESTAAQTDDSLCSFNQVGIIEKREKGKGETPFDSPPPPSVPSMTQHL
jgi:hypothetical protein